MGDYYIISGTKVRIRKDLKLNKNYGICYFRKHMKRMRGKIATIRCCMRIDYGKNVYFIDDLPYLWTVEMFEPYDDPNPDDLGFTFVLDRVKNRVVIADGTYIGFSDFSDNLAQDVCLALMDFYKDKKEDCAASFFEKLKDSL